MARIVSAQTSKVLHDFLHAPYHTLPGPAAIRHTVLVSKAYKYMQHSFPPMNVHWAQLEYPTEFVQFYKSNF